jgi:hypothetical protein
MDDRLPERQMADHLSFRLVQGIRQRALAEGEAIAETHRFVQPPVDPFQIIEREPLIVPFGADFGSAFDGRLEYQAPRFLLFYNAKYDQWSHEGEHHPKVIFITAHELAHFFTDEHRDYLRRGGGPHRSFAEFVSDSIVEQQADSFASGLLMPTHLLRPTVNEEPNVTMDLIKDVRAKYRVPLVSMLIRWTQLSDFPSATICLLPGGTIAWGFVSEGFGRGGMFSVLRGNAVVSQDAHRFIAADPTFSKYREDVGAGYAHHWLDTVRKRVSVRENYVVLPYRRQAFVFVTADEDEVADSSGHDDD